MTSLFEHAIQTGLHLFPDGKSGRTDYHAAFDWSIVCKLPRGNYIKIPLRVVFFTGCNIFCHVGRYILKNK